MSKFKFSHVVLWGPCHCPNSNLACPAIHAHHGTPRGLPQLFQISSLGGIEFSKKIVGNIFDSPTKFMISLGVINTPCIAWSFNNPQKGLSSNYPSNITMCSRNWIVNIEIDYSMAILLDHQCSITLSTLWKLFLWQYIFPFGLNMLLLLKNTFDNKKIKEKCFVAFFFWKKSN